MTYGDIEPLRAKFRPEIIRVLFVGESAPAGGAFFYKGFGQVHDEFRKVFLPLIGDQPTFVRAFQDSGFYLDDLVLEPVNWKSPAERKALHKLNTDSLAGRIASYRPNAVVAFLKAIQEPVRDAIRRANIACPYYAVPFPGNGQQGHFREEMTKILPSLL